MKILIVSEMSIPYTTGGGEIRYHLLARELVRRGNDVTWLSMHQRNSPNEETIDGVKHVHIGPRIAAPPIRSLISMLRFMLKTFFHILLHRYAIIDVQTYAPLPAALFACYLSRQKMVATIHDVSRADKGQWISNRFRYFTAATETLLYRLPYPRIIAVSASTAKALVTRWGVSQKRIRVVPNGIDLSSSPICILRPHDESRRTIDLIFAGRFVATKNLDEMIDVIRICHRNGAVKRALLIGDGPLLQSTMTQAEEAGLQGIVEFTGKLSNIEVIDRLTKAKVFIHTSSREGFPVVMIEAMSSGAAIVAYDIPGVVDVVLNEETGLLVSEHNIDEHAKACMKLLSQSELRGRIVSAALKKTRESLTISQMADRVYHTYLELTA